MTDLDLDAFPSPAVQDLIEEERRLLDRAAGNEVVEPRRVNGGTPGDLLMAVVFASKTSGRGHVVTIIETSEGRAAMCICDAMRTLHRRPKGCWAMVFVRGIAGLEQP